MTRSTQIKKRTNLGMWRVSTPNSAECRYKRTQRTFGR
uniref:Uncharacterized protein n=1 Tax=Rhizophora mucronata TaxID=61149 RepID=A0A2P2IXQ3_RHIMU